MNITDEQKDRYVSLIGEGFTTEQIALRVNLGKSTVKRHLIKLGLKTIHKKERVIIPKERIDELVKMGKSISEISDILNNKSIKYWIGKYKISLTKKHQPKIGEFKVCPQCNRTLEVSSLNFFINKKGKVHGWCKKCNCRKTLERQQNRKLECINYKGGKCARCGYDKYPGALDFHHIDPTQKEFDISKLRTYNIEKLKPELDKCICVCKNCHAEIHGEMVLAVGIEPTTKPL